LSAEPFEFDLKPIGAFFLVFGAMGRRLRFCQDQPSFRVEESRPGFLDTLELPFPDAEPESELFAPEPASFVAERWESSACADAAANPRTLRFDWVEENVLSDLKVFVDILFRFVRSRRFVPARQQFDDDVRRLALREHAPFLALAVALNTRDIRRNPALGTAVEARPPLSSRGTCCRRHRSRRVPGKEEADDVDEQVHR